MSCIEMGENEKRRHGVSGKTQAQTRRNTKATNDGCGRRAQRKLQSTTQARSKEWPEDREIMSSHQAVGAPRYYRRTYG